MPGCEWCVGSGGTSYVAAGPGRAVPHLAWHQRMDAENKYPAARCCFCRLPRKFVAIPAGFSHEPFKPESGAHLPRIPAGVHRSHGRVRGPLLPSPWRHVHGHRYHLVPDCCTRCIGICRRPPGQPEDPGGFDLFASMLFIGLGAAILLTHL